MILGCLINFILLIGSVPFQLSFVTFFQLACYLFIVLKAACQDVDHNHEMEK